MSNRFCPTNNCGRIFCWTGNLAEMEWKPVYCHAIHTQTWASQHFSSLYIFVLRAIPTQLLFFQLINFSIHLLLLFMEWIWPVKTTFEPMTSKSIFCTFAQFQFFALHNAQLRGVWDALASLGSILEIQWVGEWVMFLRFGRPLPDIAFRLPQHFVNIRF